MDYNEIAKRVADYSKRADTVAIIKLLHEVKEQGYNEGYNDCIAAYDLMNDYKLWI